MQQVIKDLSTDELMDLLMLATEQLRTAIKSKRPKEEVTAKLKELKLIQDTLLSRTSGTRK